MKKLLLFVLSAFAIICFPMCADIDPVMNQNGQEDTQSPDSEKEEQPEEEPAVEPEWQETLPERCGISYLYDWSCIPEIHIAVSLEEWNRLLAYYDEDHDTKEYVHCDVVYDKAGERTSITNAGIRLRGNTSRFRPEGRSGEMHKTDDTDWHRCHYQLNFRKYVKDSEHEIHGARKVILKFCNGDPTYVRELYAYDFFRRCGVWTAAYDVFARVYLHVEGDSREAYLGTCR